MSCIDPLQEILEYLQGRERVAVAYRLGKKMILQDVQAQLVSWQSGVGSAGSHRGLPRPRRERMRRYVRNRQSGRRLEP